MGKLVVRYEIEADKMPDNCNECPLWAGVRVGGDCRCPREVWYWKGGDNPQLYARYRSRRAKDCPLTFVEEGGSQ